MYRIAIACMLSILVLFSLQTAYLNSKPAHLSCNCVCQPQKSLIDEIYSDPNINENDTIIIKPTRNKDIKEIWIELE
ncbi:hypothetical protein DRQ25_15690 [Candidatus Fermentibacteria bacterium]|nr:MAG: hypothetical protein DRQ25_15690 [Candidatus Fermentibacteria bacterium]